MESHEVEAKQRLEAHFAAYAALARDFPELIRFGIKLGNELIHYANKINVDLVNLDLGRILWTPEGKLVIEVKGAGVKSDINGEFKTGFEGFDSMARKLPQVARVVFALGEQLIAHSYRKKINTRKIQFGSIMWSRVDDMDVVAVSIYEGSKLLLPKEVIL